MELHSLEPDAANRSHEWGSPHDVLLERHRKVEMEIHEVRFVVERFDPRDFGGTVYPAGLRSDRDIDRRTAVLASESQRLLAAGGHANPAVRVLATAVAADCEVDVHRS